MNTSVSEFKPSGASAPSTAGMNVNASSFSVGAQSFVPSGTTTAASNPFMTSSTSVFVPSTSAAGTPAPVAAKPVEPPKPKEKGILAIEKLVKEAQDDSKESDAKSKSDTAKDGTKETESEKVDHVKDLSSTFEAIKEEQKGEKETKISAKSMDQFIKQIA